MLNRLRNALGRKGPEEPNLSSDGESRLPLNSNGSEAKRIVTAVDGDDDHSELESKVPGLTTNIRKFGQILGTIMLDCHEHTLPRSAVSRPLHWAVRERNNVVLLKLLENEKWRWNTEAVAPGEKGERPLHVAAEVDNLDAFKILLDYGANPHGRETEYYGLQPVHISASKGSINVLDYLISQLVSYGAQDFITATDLEGSSALHWAVLGGDMDCLRLLLEQGATVDWVQKKGPQATPLHFACIEGSMEIVRLMAEVRPEDFRKALLVKDNQGCTPLHRAVVLDNVELVEFLLDWGADVYAEDSDGRTPTILAAIREAWEVLDMLVRRGVNPFICNRNDLRHVGHHAAMVGADPRPAKGLQEMFAKNPEWKKRLDAIDSYGYTPLQYAAGYGHVAAFHGLLSLGCSMTARSEKDKTVLHYAAKYGQLEMVSTLLDCREGMSILNAMDHKGRSALHLAASYGHHEVSELLLSKGAFCFRDDSGKTAFHNAAAKNHHHIMGAIVTYFSLVLNAADKDGSTALHLAAAKDSAEAVQYLLEIKATATEDAFGRTPMDLAIANRNEKAAMEFINCTRWKEFICEPSREYGSVVLGLIAHLPEVMKKCLDRCLARSESTRPGEFYIEYDFSILHPLEATEKTHYRHHAPMRAMKLMATLARSDLLSHPVCTTLLERKWLTYGMYCSGFIMVSNLVFVALLSYIMMTAIETDLRPHLLQTSYQNVKFNRPESVLNNSAFDDLYKRAYLSGVGTFQDTAALMILVLALVVIFFKELAELRSEGLNYFLSWPNYLEMTLFMTCGGFVYCFYKDDQNQSIGDYTYQLGAVAIFLAWFHLLRFCRPFGTFGIYSFMFFCTFKTLIQVSFFFFLLTAAFTATFSTLFQSFVYPNSTEYYIRHPDLDPTILRTSHEKVTLSALRIGAMTVGDLESLENFIYPLMDGLLAYPLLSFIFYAIFLMLMPILLNNLLTGLAIGDMASIQVNAASLRQEMQVHLHESLEKLFPKKLLERIQRDSQTFRVYPGLKVPWKTWLARWLQSGGIRQPVIAGDLSEVDQNAIWSRLHQDEDLTKIQKRLKQLDSVMSEQRALLTQILGRLDKLPAEEDTDKIGAAIIERARKRTERTEEDRKAQGKLNLAKRLLANNFSARF